MCRVVCYNRCRALKCYKQIYMYHVKMCYNATLCKWLSIGDLRGCFSDIYSLLMPGHTHTRLGTKERIALQVIIQITKSDTGVK